MECGVASEKAAKMSVSFRPKILRLVLDFHSSTRVHP